jgi:hypothetical protein
MQSGLNVALELKDNRGVYKACIYVCIYKYIYQYVYINMYI